MSYVKEIIAAVVVVLTLSCGAVLAGEPPLLKTSGNAAVIYTGKLVAVDVEDSGGAIVTVHGKFIPNNEHVQAIKCKLSGFKTKGIRWYSVLDQLENVFIGVPLPSADDNDNEKVLAAIGQTVKVAPLGDTCMRFELSEDR